LFKVLNNYSKEQKMFDKQSKEIMKKQTIILFLITILATSTTLVAQELREMPRGRGNYDETDRVEHCEQLIAELNIAAARDGNKAQKNWFGETTQTDFSYALNDATACVKRLNDDYKNGDYKLSKKWKYFGEYKLGKP
jgi:hypothetical protein